MRRHVCSSSVSTFIYCLVCLQVTGNHDYALFSCAENQKAELGKQAIILCTLPKDFHAMYWYDGTEDGRPPLASFRRRMEPDHGLCLENASYGVFENGSLLICYVNVAHERNYTAILYLTSDFYEERTVALQVIAQPGNRSVSVYFDNTCVERYHIVKGPEILRCSFNGTRPYVKLEWIERFPVGNFLTVQQTFKKTSNRNGTYDSLVDVRLPSVVYGNLVGILACVATYPFLSPEWRQESGTLLDFSQSKTFSNVKSNTYYLEINKRAALRCGDSKHVYQIWKRIQPTGGTETIGFRFDNHIQMTKVVHGIEISIDGSLVFSSPQLQHEGVYACIYNTDGEARIQKTALVLLIPPSPPYITIAGCDDAKYSCVIKEENMQNLTCAVSGIYPNASLEWVSKTPSRISLSGLVTNYETFGVGYDVSTSVEYNVSASVTGEEEIYIACRIEGPVAHIMKEERFVKLIPRSCTENLGNTGNWLSPCSAGTVMVIWISFFISSWFFIHDECQGRASSALLLKGNKKHRKLE